MIYFRKVSKKLTGHFSSYCCWATYGTWLSSFLFFYVKGKHLNTLFPKFPPKPNYEKVTIGRLYLSGDDLQRVEAKSWKKIVAQKNKRLCMIILWTWNKFWYLGIWKSKEKGRKNRFFFFYLHKVMKKNRIQSNLIRREHNGWTIFFFSILDDFVFSWMINSDDTSSQLKRFQVLKLRCESYKAQYRDLTGYNI